MYVPSELRRSHRQQAVKARGTTVTVGTCTERGPREGLCSVGAQGLGGRQAPASEQIQHRLIESVGEESGDEAEEKFTLSFTWESWERCP